MKTLFNKQKINTDNYVNVDTGETLNSEQPNLTSINIKTDKVIINSEEYFTVDSKALAYILEHFNHPEQERIFNICNLPKGCYNILHKDKKPYTKESLAELFGLTKNKYAAFMKKLLEKNIIYYLVGYANRKKVTNIMLNPNLARKQKTFHTDCTSVFRKF